MLRIFIEEEFQMGECCSGMVNTIVVRVLLVEDVLLGREEVLWVMLW